MIQLVCPQCRTTLPVAENKIGTRIFICPVCTHPLETPGNGSAFGAPLHFEEPEPFLDGDSEDQTEAFDPSLVQVQEMPRSVAARRANRERQTPPELPTSNGNRRQLNREATPGLPVGLLWGGVGIVGVVVGAALTLLLSNGKNAAPPEAQLPAGEILVPKAPDKPTGIPPNPPAANKQPASVFELAQALKAGPVAERKLVLRELSARGLESRPALAAVLEILKDPDAEMQTLAQETLTHMGPASTTDLLVYSSALRDPSPKMRVFAAEQMAELGEQAKGELDFLRLMSLVDNGEVADAAWNAVFRIEEALLAGLTKNLLDPSPIVRVNAARELSDMGASARAALPSLFEALADDNSAVRLAVADAFLAIGPYAVPVLSEGIRDLKVQVRLAAINALGRMGPDARFVLPELIGLLTNADARVAEEALQALVRISEFAITDMVRALEHEKSLTRQKKLIEILDRLGPNAAPVLLSALASANPEVLKLTEQLLRKIQSLPPLPPRLDHTGPEAEIHARLRDWFLAVDLNRDGFLDKEELARALRGPNARAYDFTPDGKPARHFGPRDFDMYPDYAFLSRLDRQNIGRISRAEFDLWAYQHVEFLKKDAEERHRLAEVQRRLMEKGLSAAVRHQQELAMRQMLAIYAHQHTAQEAMHRHLQQIAALNRVTGHPGAAGHHVPAHHGLGHKR